MFVCLWYNNEETRDLFQKKRGKKMKTKIWKLLDETKQYTIKNEVFSAINDEMARGEDVERYCVLIQDYDSLIKNPHDFKFEINTQRNYPGDSRYVLSCDSDSGTESFGVSIHDLLFSGAIEECDLVEEIEEELN